MGIKLAGTMALVLAIVLGAFYWYYTDTQERIGVLRENNARLEIAVQTSEASLKTLQSEMSRINDLNSDLQADLQRAEAYGDELRTKLREHNLTALAIKKPNILEGKMNGATANLWREIMSDTGGDGNKPLPQWLQPVPESGAQDTDSNTDTEN